MEMLNNHSAGVKHRKNEVMKQMKEKLKLEPRLGRYEHADKPLERDIRSYTEKLGRCYELHIENFLSDAEIQEVGYTKKQIEHARMSQGDIGFPEPIAELAKVAEPF